MHYAGQRRGARHCRCRDVRLRQDAGGSGGGSVDVGRRLELRGYPSLFAQLIRGYPVKRAMPFCWPRLVKSGLYRRLSRPVAAGDLPVLLPVGRSHFPQCIPEQPSAFLYGPAFSYDFGPLHELSHVTGTRLGEFRVVTGRHNSMVPSLPRHHPEWMGHAAEPVVTFGVRCRRTLLGLVVCPQEVRPGCPRLSADRRSVELLIVAWPGIVSGVLLPSSFSRTIEMCSRSLTRVKPRISNALTTLAFGASTGNFWLKHPPPSLR
jgi:hypothetical protein